MSELWAAKQGLKGREGLAGARAQSDSNNLIGPERSKGSILPIFAPPRAPFSPRHTPNLVHAQIFSLFTQNLALTPLDFSLLWP